jgi:hypothetical protein
MDPLSEKLSRFFSILHRYALLDAIGCRIRGHSWARLMRQQQALSYALENSPALIYLMRVVGGLA